MTPAKPTASIIVCVYNRPQQILTCLDSLRRLFPLEANHPGEIEVLVVDDGSADDTAAQVLAYQTAHPTLRIVLHKNLQNLGLSAARNVGINLAQGEFVFFTDSDCTVETTWLNHMLFAFSTDAIVAVAGVSLDRQPRNLAERAYSGTTRIGMSTFQGRSLVGNNMGFRRSVLSAYLFDPSLRYYCDEDDLAWRLRSDGHSIAFAPQAVVHHDHPMDFRKYMRLAWYQGQGSARFWYKKGVYLGRDLTALALAVVSLPLGWLNLWLLLVPTCFLLLQLAALVYNQTRLKGKHLLEALAVLGVETAYCCWKLTSVCCTYYRILTGSEQPVVESKRRWWARRSATPTTPAR